MGYGEVFGAAEDDPIRFAADAEQPRLYFAPEVINQELCRMLGRQNRPVPMREAAVEQLDHAPPSEVSPTRGYEWPIR